MITHLYGIYDKTANYYLNVFPSMNDGTAIRSFDTIISGAKDSIYARYPDQFEVRYIGSLNGSDIFSLSDRFKTDFSNAPEGPDVLFVCPTFKLCSGDQILEKCEELNE